MGRPTILVNLNRCTGCWTCSIACKVAHKLPKAKWWNYIRTLGNGRGVDEPAGTWPKLHMSWMPIFTSDCILCAQRTNENQEPYCTYNCPTNALAFGDLDDPDSRVSLHMKEMRQKGYRIFQLQEWENTRPEIYYSRK